MNRPASYDPNSFYRLNKASAPFAPGPRLTGVEGGEEQQNSPLEWLIQRRPRVDVIVAVHSSINPYWPNGKSLIATCETVCMTAAIPVRDDVAWGLL
ncbi:uncharacterized protein BO80DRAFT_422928 [Aspergillus ibericus CBS 121593]|uniref:Lysophospholipase n=1 Tax=Aspergillus ibericus CBS 121593 TaxID=1448316 RepID=A0A395H6C8_9EURO|nr:hypothetical protein BO80DRAFT_422928 [Aspergillus ibericus CBS 121593]RAL03472.1 hypothetical protein BO80DRAFT_422928 [Aspergillus ibericus CBS 121593]